MPWGDIVTPRKMLLASFLASQFHAPWGCAFIRLQENGWKVGKEKRALLVLQRGFDMWCNAAHQPYVEGGLHDRADRDHTQDGLGDPRYSGLGGGIARLSRHLQSVVSAAGTTGSGAHLSPGVAG